MIPTRDRRPFVRECLESIVGQSEDGWSIVMVDDGSTDGTEEEVRGLALPRLRYLRNETARGASESRNRGVAEADSDLVAFIDSDDRLHPSYLARVRRAFREHPDAGIVCCDSRVIDAEGRVLHGGASFQTMEAARKRFALRAGPRSFEDIFVFSTTFPGTAMRREALRRAGGFPQPMFPMDDVVLQLRAAAAGVPVYYLDEVLADYRVHGGSESAGSGKAVFTCAKKVEALAACAPLAPAGTRTGPLRRRRADAQLELAIAQWWAGRRARAASDLLRSLALDPRVAAGFLRDRLRRRTAAP